LKHRGNTGLDRTHELDASHVATTLIWIEVTVTTAGDTDPPELVFTGGGIEGMAELLEAGWIDGEMPPVDEPGPEGPFAGLLAAEFGEAVPLAGVAGVEAAVEGAGTGD
jgi:hypothetical protein